MVYRTETDFRIPSAQEQVTGILRNNAVGRIRSAAAAVTWKPLAARRERGSRWKREATWETLRSV